MFDFCFVLQMSVLPTLPLAKRVYVSSRNQTLPGYHHANRPARYKAWSENAMNEALKAVIEDGRSVRRAAEEFGVPKSTLGDRVSGCVLPGAVSGPLCYLDDEEEKELAQFVCHCASIGYAKTRSEVLAIVERVLSSRGIEKTVTNGWWEGFVKRHPYLTLRTAAPLSRQRAISSDPAVMSKYFDLLKQTIEDNGLGGKPCNIFNMDKTGMPLDPKPLKTIHHKGERNPVAPASGLKTQITVLGCVSAGGYSLPPMVIWDRKRLRPELTVGEVPGTIYGLSAKGWMDQELFDAWFHCHFLKYAPLAHPLLLLMDGHSSHYCPDTVRMAAKEQVIMFVLPPNTTHITQTLDKGCFGPLKVHWRQACHQFMVEIL